MAQLDAAAASIDDLRAPTICIATDRRKADGDRSRARKPFALRRPRFAPLKHALAFSACLLLAFPASAQTKPDDPTSLIKLESRTFDLGADVRRLRRDADFIPIRVVDWIRNLTEQDRYLHPTVIHIRAPHMNAIGTPVWRPDMDRELFPPAPDLAEAWGLDSYGLRWGSNIVPPDERKRGTVVLFPRTRDIDHHVSCAFDRMDRVPTFCAINALYPPDPKLKIKVRVYQVTDPLNDFEEIIKRTINFIYCLDVTKELELDGWRPLEERRPGDFEDFVGACKSTAS